MINEENGLLLQEKLHTYVVESYARWYGVDRQSVKIIMATYGKPEVQINGTLVGIKFNISHTKGIGIIIFSRKQIGIDIEFLREADYRISNRFFHEIEDKYIYDAKEKILQNERFTEIWVKKEAYFKYTGRGLCSKMRNINVLNYNYGYGKIDIKGKKYIYAFYSGD